jgi:hypothetical protein
MNKRTQEETIFAKIREIIQKIQKILEGEGKEAE